MAPEHITVSEEDLPFIQNAGSVFVGDYSAQAAGDYASGPNHVLPTSGQARFRGGLSVADFVKVITVQQLSAQGTEADCAGGRMSCRGGGTGGARAVDPREVRACLVHGRRCGRCLRTIRRWRGGKGCGWISMRTRSGARREFSHDCGGWVRNNLPSIRSASQWKRRWPRILGVAAPELLLTNGVDEAIHLLCETYLEPGDEAMIVVPTYSMYRIYVMAAGAQS